MLNTLACRFGAPKCVSPLLRLFLALLILSAAQLSEAGVRFGGGRAMGHQHSAGAAGPKNTPSNSVSTAPPPAQSAASVAPSSAPVAPVPGVGPSSAGSSSPGASSVSSSNASSGTAPYPSRPTPSAPASVAPPASSFFGGFASRMLMGAALGLGVMSLAHAWGWAPEQAQGLMMVLLLLLVGGCIYMIWQLLFNRKASTYSHHHLSPMNVSMGSGFGQAHASTQALGRTYNPKNVGNDASARPWESQGGLFSDASSTSSEAAWRAVQKPFEPQQLGLWETQNDKSKESPGHLTDVESFKNMAKEHFLNLQDAWDHLDIDRLASFLNPEMLTLVKTQLAQLGLKPQKTEVMMLQAQWLGLQPVEGHHIASVELSGMSREANEPSFTPFREIWSWTRPIADEHAAWLVCGLEPLQ